MNLTNLNHQVKTKRQQVTLRPPLNERIEISVLHHISHFGKILDHIIEEDLSIHTNSMTKIVIIEQEDLVAERSEEKIFATEDIQPVVHLLKIEIQERIG